MRNRKRGLPGAPCTRVPNKTGRSRSGRKRPSRVHRAARRSARPPHHHAPCPPIDLLDVTALHNSVSTCTPSHCHPTPCPWSVGPIRIWGHRGNSTTFSKRTRRDFAQRAILPHSTITLALLFTLPARPPRHALRPRSRRVPVLPGGCSQVRINYYNHASLFHSAQASCRDGLKKLGNSQEMHLWDGVAKVRPPCAARCARTPRPVSRPPPLPSLSFTPPKSSASSTPDDAALPLLSVGLIPPLRAPGAALPTPPTAPLALSSSSARIQTRSGG